jgi:hypothetical protein
METSKPAEEYSFHEGPLGEPRDDRPMVYGDARNRGNYMIGGQYIVDIYNESRHGRKKDELQRMGEINEAFHKKDFERMRDLIESTRKEYQTGAPPKVQEMWKKVFAAYENAAKAKR